MSRKTKPVVEQKEWEFALLLGLLPQVIVDVRNFRAHIMVFDVENNQYKDVTDMVKNGQKFAEESVEVSGGSLGRSGWYPPSEKLFRKLVRLGLTE